ncbi:MAG TPA: hypothetical protein VE081_09695 [Sporichthyaceae bacterium]|nr:hypothetical protein [Sporichthyaceae bacterium]
MAELAVPVGARTDHRTWWFGFAAVATVSFSLYLIAPPHVPDLAAQTARAEAAREGAYLWWSGWFGGLSLPSYSIGGPWLMAHLGVGLSAALAGTVACALAPMLFEGTRRPRAGAIIFAVEVFLNVLTGRVTFALGLAAAVVAAALLHRRRGRWAALAAVCSCLLSPLAGLWLGLIAVTVAIVDTTRRRAAVGMSAVLLTVAGAVALAFHEGTGTMDFPWWHVLVALIAIATVAALCPERAIRVGAAVFALATIGAAVLPTAVGTNMMRLIWLGAGPVVLATVRLPRVHRRVWRRALGTCLAALAMVWPVTDLGVQLARAAGPQAGREYYASLLDELALRSRLAGPQALGQRAEIVDPSTHWSAAYVAPTVPIARGWDRQADRGANPFFYDGTLNRSNYRTFLDDLAVRWVALPTQASLDFAAKAEADLVRSDLPYLQSVWRDARWEVFEVRGAKPLVRGAMLQDLGPDEITFSTARAGTVALQIRWSPLFALDREGSEGKAGCVQARGPWTSVRVDGPGTYTLASRLHLPADNGNCS